MKVEPNADMRQMAVMFYQMFVALVDQGFSEKQALIIIGHVISAQFKGEK